MKTGNRANSGEMLQRDRILTTLRREEADRVPYTELGVDPYLAQKLMGWEEVQDESRDLEKNAPEIMPNVSSGNPANRRRRSILERTSRGGSRRPACRTSLRLSRRV